MQIVNELYEDDVLKELSVRFRQYRIASEMTQADLAKKSAVSVRTISRFEKGEDISLLTIVKLFKALNLAKNFEVMIKKLKKQCGNGAMKKMVYKIEEIAEIVRPIAKNCGANKIYLFGSYARGEVTENSDIDLLVDNGEAHGLVFFGFCGGLESIENQCRCNNCKLALRRIDKLY